MKRNIDNNIDNNYENQTDKKNNGFDFDKELEKVTETIKNMVGLTLMFTKSAMGYALL